MCKISFPVIGMVVMVHALFSLNFAQAVLYPSLRDTVYRLDTCRISFKGFSREQKRVAIELFRHDKAVSLISPSASRIFKYPWFVGSDISPGSGYKIKITGKGENPVSCMSDEFTIKNPEIVIVAPAAGAGWIFTDSLFATIKWKFTSNQTSGFKIMLLKNRSAKMALATKAKYGNSLDVRMDQNSRIKSGDDYRIRITSVADTSISAISGPFSIRRSSYAFSQLERIPLVWMPKDDALEYLFALKLSRYSRVKLGLAGFVDRRNDTANIGENIESSNKRMVTTNESVAAWCRDNIRMILRDQNIQTVEMGARLSNPLPETTADGLPTPMQNIYSVALQATILEFFVTEGDQYKADVAMEFTLVDQSGNPLWTGIKRSVANNWGKSYSAVNYYECISSAYAYVICQLLTDANVERILGSF
jgi:hypothetical protein